MHALSLTKSQIKERGNERERETDRERDRERESVIESFINSCGTGQNKPTSYRKSMSLDLSPVAMEQTRISTENLKKEISKPQGKQPQLPK